MDPDQGTYRPMAVIYSVEVEQRDTQTVVIYDELELGLHSEGASALQSLGFQISVVLADYVRVRSRGTESVNT
jgi:hypothetical protein